MWELLARGENCWRATQHPVEFRQHQASQEFKRSHHHDQLDEHLIVPHAEMLLRGLQPRCDGLATHPQARHQCIDDSQCGCCTQILRTFFALIFGTILFSMLIGLCFLPVVFSIIGPPRVGDVGTDLYAEDDTLPTTVPPAAARQKESGAASSSDSLELVYGKGSGAL